MQLVLILLAFVTILLIICVLWNHLFLFKRNFKNANYSSKKQQDENIPLLKLIFQKKNRHHSS